MKIENVRLKDVREALRVANVRYEGNLTLRGKPPGPVALGVKDAGGPGGRLGRLKADGTRRVVAGVACWHAYGHFFEALFAARPEAVVRTGGRTITGPHKEQGNWVDSPVVGEKGVWHSDLCLCERGIVVPYRARRPARKLSHRPGGIIMAVTP